MLVLVCLIISISDGAGGYNDNGVGPSDGGSDAFGVSCHGDIVGNGVAIIYGHVVGLGGYSKDGDTVVAIVLVLMVILS